MPRIVLAYSGSARSSIAIRWMIEAWQAEVVTLTLDLGQRDELDAVRERALACGAIRAHVLDERERFARDYLLRALRAGAASDEDGAPLGRLLTRPLIARQLVDVARMEGAGTIAHAVSRDPDDRLRLERAMRDAGPDLIVRAPLMDAEMTDGELLAFADEHALPIPSLDLAAAVIDANLWERCTRTPVPVPGIDAESDASESDHTPNSAAPDSAATVVLELSRGTPVGLNGVTMPLLEIISSLDTIAGAHGVGRTQRLARAIDGRIIAQRCDAPAATVLDVALQQFQRLALPDDASHDAARISALYREIVSRGAWSAPSRLGYDAFVETIQTRVTGSVRLRLLKGSISVMDCAFADEHEEQAMGHRP